MTAFPLETLSELRWSNEIDGLTKVAVMDEGSGRWSSYHTLVFSAEGKLYGVTYKMGLTESQDYSTSDQFSCYGKDEVEVFEVEPYEYTETRYRKVTS